MRARWPCLVLATVATVMAVARADAQRVLASSAPSRFPDTPPAFDATDHADAGNALRANGTTENDTLARANRASDAEVVMDAAEMPNTEDTREEPSPTEERAAIDVLGNDDADVPDPVVEESERTSSAEGEALPPRARVGNEIAALSDRACFRALQRARVPFERVRTRVPGIAAPVRITGAIGGVRYVASDSREVHELMDCRLAVALVRFSRLLRHLGVVEVLHYSTYRPPGSAAVARQPLQARHGGGLAIDAAWFYFQNGDRLSVLRDFHGHRGRPVCGPEARVPNHTAARLLRTIVCDSARRGLFHVLLTPNHDRAHRNHFHLEVTRGVDWIFVR